MFKFFEDMKKENENFFYDYKVDDENILENVFWSNASSRAAYADFGDCITFDTTYKSNKHHLPLAVFVDVNNHLQATIFGVALMGNESEQSFKWVFSRFLECIGGKQPICILTGLFCHHVIAVFENLRLDEIPSRYILQRYTKDAVTNPDFNRRDYMTTTYDGTSIQYRRTILYSEAVKIINKGCSSEAKFQIALSAFRDANSRLDNEDAELENNEDAEMENNEQSSNQDYTTRETDEQNDIPQNENNDPYADIRPPLVAITKGSKTTDAARKNGKCKPPAPAHPEPELDEYGRPKVTRVCGTCNKIDGHNSITCKARQLAKKLLETHEKVYGSTTSSGNIKVRIRNLLARQHSPEIEDEEKLDTDEGECFEDETDDEEYENKDEDEDISEQEETQNTPDVDHKLENLNKKEGQRKCSVCNLRQGHYASTCPNKDKILEQQIIERQTSDANFPPARPRPPARASTSAPRAAATSAGAATSRPHRAPPPARASPRAAPPPPAPRPAPPTSRPRAADLRSRAAPAAATAAPHPRRRPSGRGPTPSRAPGRPRAASNALHLPPPPLPHQSRHCRPSPPPASCA
ncbi:hypothetical protein QYE76_030130 [Lolium multiflorum]|uniref:Protein FAR1-RELATED SEQUENCE n=1 Tax=Lolium multiflorum TaxID=4521 RepID=A0AAD8QPU8_LOLMU|nr:hypothetical protein QYE76_030130 [Lolium multiflorum]